MPYIPGTLPPVRGSHEIARFLEAVPSMTTIRTALTTAYAAGFRASEVVGLNVKRYR